ncbi:MAG: DUF5615 family PIN-like protein [Saprospiraceae bacterium]
MKLSDFKLLADENIDPDLIDYLRNQGFDIKGVKDVGLIAAKDPAWLKLANLEDRVIVTQDSDFGKIIFTQATDFTGIIFLRPGSLFVNFHIQTIQAILAADPDLFPPFILTAKNVGNSVRIKIRHVD